MRTKLRQRAVDLRVQHQLSYSAIRRKLGVSKSTLSYWLQEYPLTAEKILELRRKGWQKGEASRERYRLTMRKKRETVDDAVYKKYVALFRKEMTDDVWYIAGLMLYWGEGDKRNKYRLVMANTDPHLLRFFIRWALRFLNINRTDFKVQLHLYDNMIISNEEQFWRKNLRFPISQFYKTQVRKVSRNTYSYRGSLRHGTCSIFLLGAEKKREVMMAIKAFLDITSNVL